MIGNGTPLSAHMFTQIKKKNCPGQTSEWKPRVNRKSVMSTERLMSVQKGGKLKNKKAFKPISKIRAKGRL